MCVADSDAFSGIIWNLSIRRKVLVGHPAEWSCFLAAVLSRGADGRDVDSEGDDEDECCIISGPPRRCILSANQKGERKREREDSKGQRVFELECVFRWAGRMIIMRSGTVL